MRLRAVQQTFHLLMRFMDPTDQATTLAILFSVPHGDDGWSRDARARPNLRQPLL